MTATESTGLEQIAAERVTTSAGAGGLPESSAGGARPHTAFLGKRIARRTFLEGTAAVGAGAVVASHVGLAAGTPKKPVVKALTASSPGLTDLVRVKEQVFNDVCSNNCWQGCFVEAHVRDGRLTKTAMKPLPDSRYNRICLRGLSHAQWISSPARLKFPMKRVGQRGSGKWQRITWDEATSTIADSMKSIRERFGSSAFGFMSGSGNYGSVAGYAASTLASAFGGTSIGQWMKPSRSAGSKWASAPAGLAVTSRSTCPTQISSSCGATTSPRRKFRSGTS